MACADFRGHFRFCEGVFEPFGCHWLRTFFQFVGSLLVAAGFLAVGVADPIFDGRAQLRQSLAQNAAIMGLRQLAHENEREHPGSCSCHAAGDCPYAFAGPGQSVLIGALVSDVAWLALL